MEPKLLLIDTGHSVKYPGASGIKKEVEWVRAIAEALVNKIDTKQWNVVRVPDTYPGETSQTTLIKRINWINSHSGSGDMLISIHANAADKKPHIRGVSVCYKGGVKGDNIQITKHCKMQALALSAAYRDATGVPYFNSGEMQDANGRYGRLGMVRDTKPFSLLIECGFVGNAQDMAVSAESAAQGIANYINHKNMPVVIATGPTPSDEQKTALQQMNERSYIHDISNPLRTVSLADLAVIMMRVINDPRNKN